MVYTKIVFEYVGCHSIIEGEFRRSVLHPSEILMQNSPNVLFREKKFWEKSFLRSSANAKKIIINFYFGSPAALLLLLLLLLKELVKNS